MVGRQALQAGACSACLHAHHFCLYSTDGTCVQEALAVIDWAFEAGWDPEDATHGKGGMIYFKDAEVRAASADDCNGC